MLIRLNVLWTFLRTVGMPMLILTCASVYVVAQYHTAGPLPLFLVAKIITDLFVFYLWYHLRAHQLYYYYNLGIRKRLLFSFALGADLLSFVLIHFILSIWV
jgi:hypothetical protein